MPQGNSGNSSQVRNEIDFNQRGTLNETSEESTTGKTGQTDTSDEAHEADQAHEAEEDSRPVEREQRPDVGFAGGQKTCGIPHTFSQLCRLDQFRYTPITHIPPLLAIFLEHLERVAAGREIRGLE